MTIPEREQLDERRRRTEQQRRKRAETRLCGYCGEKADGGLIEWEGRGKPLLIPICQACRARMDGSWRHLQEIGVWCPADDERPCADCVHETKDGIRPGGILRRLLRG